MSLHYIETLVDHFESSPREREKKRRVQREIEENGRKSN